jgi:hypothetical protein
VIIIYWKKTIKLRDTRLCYLKAREMLI